MIIYHHHKNKYVLIYIRSPLQNDNFHLIIMNIFHLIMARFQTSEPHIDISIH